MNTTELVPVETGPPPTLFGTNDPQAIIAAATAQAKALAAVIKDRKLYSMIQGREYVRLEGWSLLGTLLGVFPVCEWTRELSGGNGWEARVEARTLDGHTVGAAEAQCSRDESTWARRDEYALRSMAQTRATAKALRIPLGFVMVLGGYDPTPAEEVDGNGVIEGQVQRQSVARQTPAQSRPDAITKPTMNAIAEGYNEVKAARGEEFGSQVRPAMMQRWPHAFKAQSNEVRALTEIEGLEVLAFLDEQKPVVSSEEAEQPSMV